MNFNVWNIKEMLSIPSGPGTTKSSNWNNNQTDYTALSDSQFLFGSQFCPENSETLSAPLDFSAHLRHSKQSQQNSLDSEPSIFTKYQTKPQLFAGDTKDIDLFSLPLPVGKSKGLLTQFEEKNKRTKDQCDSETLYNFVSQIRESIHRLQTSVEKSEEHLSSRSQSILDSLENVAKTLQDTARSQSDLIFEAVQEKSNVEQAILEIQKKFETRQAEFIEMKSNLENLEVLVAQQSKDFQQLCEQLDQLNVPSILAELKRLILVPQILEHVKDNTSQTSPSLTQSLNFTRQEKYASEELVMWQAQAHTAAGNPSTGSLVTREFGIMGEGAKGDALQKEVALPALWPCKGNEHVKDKSVQTNCKNWAITKADSKNHGSRIPGHKVLGDSDLLHQGTSQLISLDLHNFAMSIKNLCPEYQAKSIFSCAPSEQLETEQKGRTVERGRKCKRQPTRKTQRGRFARKREQTPSKTCIFNYKYQNPQSPVSDERIPPTEQQEPLAQPLHLRGPRSSTKSVCHVLGGTVKSSKIAPAVQGSLSKFPECSSRNKDLHSSSSQGDHQMRWFSDLNLGNSESPPCKETGKNLLYDLGFDSSDDDF
ncbi:interactor of HORMAD1 protein 1 [Callospermophilus lateralis]|uniref:interactor of HORMAD1 protein 1 n=1 Tax=Callospermophilus lateralis TaxID=76772 RepID=UPI00405426DD